MPVHFPEYPDVHLANAPLDRVICQVRFPLILRIATEDPAQFQELIRDAFPKPEIQQSVVIGPLGQSAPPPQAEIRPRVFRFKSKAEDRTVTLAPDFFALEFESYDSWHTFSEALGSVFGAVQQVYDIPYSTRIGLRYVNILTLENTKTASLDDMCSILRDELVTMLRISEIEGPYLLKLQIRTEVGDGHFAFRFGLNEDRENEFRLDFDRYIEGEVEVDDLLQRCERYHHMIYNAFRWSIANDKLDIFEPADS